MIACMPGERARTNLALLYGGVGRAPLSRVVIDRPDRFRAAVIVAESPQRC